MANEDASIQDEKHEEETEVETEGTHLEVDEESSEEEEEETEEEVVEEEEEEEVVESKSSRRDPRIQELVETNKMLRDLLSARAFQAPPSRQPEVEEESPAFEDPEVEKAFSKRLASTKKQFQGQLGAAMEEVDSVRFDRVLAKEGIEEDSPEYERVTTALQHFREEQAQYGRYYKRADAYAILKAKGVIKAKTKAPVKRVTVVKTKPNVAIQRATKKSAKPTQKGNFKSLSLEDKEKALENTKF